MPYLEGLLMERARDGLPPSSEMLALELRGPIESAEVSDALADAAFGTVMGPADAGEGHRWLLQGSLGRARLALRPLVQSWRDRGARVRVDADPIDL